MDSTCGVLLSFKGRIILQIIPISLPPTQKRTPSRCNIIGFETHFFCYFSLHSKLYLYCCVHMVFLCSIINPSSRLFFSRKQKMCKKCAPARPRHKTHTTRALLWTCFFVWFSYLNPILFIISGCIFGILAVECCFHCNISKALVPEVQLGIACCCTALLCYCFPFITTITTTTSTTTTTVLVCFRYCVPFFFSLKMCLSLYFYACADFCCWLPIYFMCVFYVSQCCCAGCCCCCLLM